MTLLTTKTFSNYYGQRAAFFDVDLGDCLRSSIIGLEKEGIRMSPLRFVSSTPHPISVGSSLMHPYITIDFSESMLELITPPMQDKKELLNFFHYLHIFFYHNIGDDVVWAASVPCAPESDNYMPEPQFGSSNLGRMRKVYARSVGKRYGPFVQSMSGLHFNFSFSNDFWSIYSEIENQNLFLENFRSESYMALIRNIRRFSWLLIYLFGSSPALSKTFTGVVNSELEEFDCSTYYSPYATSLRMREIWYRNSKIENYGININYNSVTNYIQSLVRATHIPCPDYKSIGIKRGEYYNQLNANVIQNENEYYDLVRPKRFSLLPIKGNLSPRNRDIHYLELRILDIDPYSPLGVTEEQLYFLEIFMFFCLIANSPKTNKREQVSINENIFLVSHRGRDPCLKLDKNGEGVFLCQWAEELLDAMMPIAELIDGNSKGPCVDSLCLQRKKVQNPEFTPSAKMLKEMRDSGKSFFDFVWDISKQYKEQFCSLSLETEFKILFERLRGESLENQRKLEESDDIGFDEFVRNYNSRF